jgi:hypothetical protein
MIPQPSPVFPTPVSPMKRFLGFGDKLQFGESVDLLAVDPGLPGKGKGVEGPSFRQISLADAPFQGGFLPGMPLGPGQAQEKLRVGDFLLLGSAQLLFVDFQNALQAQVLQKLFQFFIHRPGRFLSSH